MTEPTAAPLPTPAPPPRRAASAGGPKSPRERWPLPTAARVALLSLALAGCGDAPPPPPPAAKAAPRPAAAPTPAAASADEVARESRGNVRCPAPPLPPRATGQPVDDVVGVRPGMAWDEAAQRVLCSHPLLVTSVDAANRFNLPLVAGQPLRQGLWARHAQPRVPKTSKDVLREMQDSAIARGSNRAVRDVAPGEAKWYLGAVGLPGQERVTHVTREEWFPEGQWPTLASVEQALVAKYGTPTQRGPGGATVELSWSHGPDGRPTRSHCALHPQPGAGVQLSPDCGVGVAAHLHTRPDNPGLVQFIRVGVVDQARGYELVEQTERLLQQQESERRAKQVQEAGQKAKGPTL